jgi:ribosomal protein S14
MPQSEHVTTKLVPPLYRSITISRLLRAVTGNAAKSTANYGKCCRSVAPPRRFGLPGHHEIATEVAISRGCLREAAAGGKIGGLEK